jgi:LPS-assembly protein
MEQIYDWFETRMRLNYGGQATMSLPNGGFINTMIGHRARLPANSYAQADAANVGLNSGWICARRTRRAFCLCAFLRPSASSPRAASTRAAAGRRRRIRHNELDPISLQLQYANYASQQAIGFDVPPRPPARHIILRKTTS